METPEPVAVFIFEPFVNKEYPSKSLIRKMGLKSVRSLSLLSNFSLTIVYKYQLK